ncbi:MAG TPA: SagB/ThcOx family dehydrogenase [Nitrososphaerales archaeon]
MRLSGFQSRALPIVLILLAAIMLYVAYLSIQPTSKDIEYMVGEIQLFEPVKKGTVSIEEAISRRRSIRNYTSEPLNLQEVGQLLWAAQGVTEPNWSLRAAPSAGGTYPLEIYIVVSLNGVDNLPPGVYRYIPKHHSIILIAKGDKMNDLAVAALDQQWVSESKVSIVIAALFERTTDRYGERGIRYVYMEAGHASQNIYLQAVALNLGTVAIGAFHDEQVQKIVDMPDKEKPLYILPVGRPKPGV